MVEPQGDILLSIVCGDDAVTRSKRLWLLAILITLAAASWQRYSGPTYPTRIKGELGGIGFKSKLLRTHSINGDLPVKIILIGAGEKAGAEESVPTGITGNVSWRRYPSSEPWQDLPLVTSGLYLQANIPAQPAAGKVEYRVELRHGDQQLVLPAQEAVVARFKGDVPFYVLIVHIIVIFCAMLWSNRAGLEAVVGGDALARQAWTTVVLLAIGGLVLGPIVQKAAFGAYWTGWPLGEDLTDNKLAVAVLVWLVAALRARTGGGRAAAVVAAVITLVIFAIPHSLHGSTLDYQSGTTVSGTIFYILNMCPTTHSRLSALPSSWKRTFRPTNQSLKTNCRTPKRW
jgi:hypothetical protein